ncbi:MAG: IS3 family transposase [Saprospiraceae bacterium]|nr:IS3 family transposase [Saprospiraceae bacterium]
MVGPSTKRHAFSYLQGKYEQSTSLICRTIELARSTKYRKPVKDDREVENKLMQLAVKYPTRGVDWYYLKIRQEGHKWNRKRILRIYRKLNLQKRRKHKRRINRPYKQGLSQPLMPNVTWSMDFMSNGLEDGRTVCILTIIDDYNRECLAIECGISIQSTRVIRVLEQLIEQRGQPEQIRTDNGPEFTSHAFSIWCESKGIDPLFIQPGKPHQNGFIERFNRTYREDILDAYIFNTLPQLQIVTNQWIDNYNTGHPHQSLGGLTPIAFEYSRRKEISAYEKVKVKMNDSQRSSTLTLSSPEKRRSLCEIQME